jgi:hypothetical protein
VHNAAGTNLAARHLNPLHLQSAAAAAADEKKQQQQQLEKQQQRREAEGAAAAVKRCMHFSPFGTETERSQPSVHLNNNLHLQLSMNAQLVSWSITCCHRRCPC